MTIVAGVLTWNDADRCRASIAALQQYVTGLAGIVVLDQGSDVPLDGRDLALTPLPVAVEHVATNRGCHAGTTTLVSRILDLPSVTHLLYVQDDWVCTQPLDLADLLPALANPAIGQLRLAERPIDPPTKYFTYGVVGDDALAALSYRCQPLEPLATRRSDPDVVDPPHALQRLRLVWSHHPSLMTRVTAERFLLQSDTETIIGRRYFASGLLTLAAVPGYFTHTRAPHNQRTIAGWRH